MGADLIHWLTGAGGDLRQVGVVCGTRDATCATWQRAAVTCPQCRDTLRSRVGARDRRRTPAGGLSEKQWLAQVRALAREHHWMTYHTLRSQGSEAGWVDLVCLKPPVLLLAELKTQQGRLTPHQQQWLEGLRAVDQVHVHLWRPDDWTTVRQVLAESQTS